MYRMCVCVMLPRQISASSPRSPPVAPWNTAPCPTAAASPWVSWRWPGWPPMKERQFQQHRSQHLQHLRHPAIISRLIWSAQSRCGFSKSKDKCVFFFVDFLDISGGPCHLQLYKHPARACHRTCCRVKAKNIPWEAHLVSFLIGCVTLW